MGVADEDRSERKRKLELRLPLVFGSMPFALAGVDSILQGRALFGVVNLGMAVANLIAARFIGRAPVWTHLLLGLLNVAVAVLTAVDYLNQGKRGLPYAWAGVAVFFSCSASSALVEREPL